MGEPRVSGLVGPRARAPADVASRVARTVELIAERGYALTPERLGALALGGRLHADEVLAVVDTDARLALVDGRVVPRERATLAAESRARQESGSTARVAAERLAREYATALRRAAPSVRAVLVSGSLASGGWSPGDDVDVSLVVDDGTKHLCYLVALGVAARFGLRSRASPAA
ncbi:MAG: hypothetical protein ACYDCK_11560, partial [Thermoplasmatota archaeon]